MPALTNQRREKFVQNIVSGMTQRQAYFDAFPNAANWQPKSVDEAACTLFHTKEVADRYQELQSYTALSAVLSRQGRMLILTDIAEDEDLPPKNRMQAIDLLNKMDGEYVKKVEATITTPLSDVAEKVDDILNE